jgi:hypothetical protein
VTTIFLHLVAAVAAHRLSHVAPPAATQAAPSGAGMTGLIVVILIGAVLGAVAYVIRALGALVAAFVQVVAAVTSLVFVMAVAAVVVLALLVHL